MAKNTRKISKRRSDRRKTRTTKKHKGGNFLSNIMGKSKTEDDVTQEIKTKPDRLNKLETIKKDLTDQIAYYKKSEDKEKDPNYKSGYEKKIKKLESDLQIATEASKALSDAATSSRVRKAFSGFNAVMSNGKSKAVSALNAARQGIPQISQVMDTLKRPFTKIAKYPDESHDNKFFIGKREPNKTQFSISEYKLVRTKPLKDLLQEIESDAETQGPGVYTLSYFFNIGGKDETK